MGCSALNNYNLSGRAALILLVLREDFKYVIKKYYYNFQVMDVSSHEVPVNTFLGDTLIKSLLARAIVIFIAHSVLWAHNYILQQPAMSTVTHGTFLLCDLKGYHSGSVEDIFLLLYYILVNSSEPNNHHWLVWCQLTLICNESVGNTSMMTSGEE